MYAKAGTQRTLDMEKATSSPVDDLAMSGMSPILVHLVSCPLAPPNTSLHALTLVSRRQSSVELASAPESMVAQMTGSLVSVLAIDSRLTVELSAANDDDGNETASEVKGPAPRAGMSMTLMGDLPSVRFGPPSVGTWGTLMPELKL